MKEACLVNRPAPDHRPADEQKSDAAATEGPSTNRAAVVSDQARLHK